MTDENYRKCDISTKVCIIKIHYFEGKSIFLFIAPRCHR